MIFFLNTITFKYLNTAKLKSAIYLAEPAFLTPRSSQGHPKVKGQIAQKSLLFSVPQCSVRLCPLHF